MLETELNIYKYKFTNVKRRKCRKQASSSLQAKFKEVEYIKIKIAKKLGVTG